MQIAHIYIIGLNTQTCATHSHTHTHMCNTLTHTHAHTHIDTNVLDAIFDVKSLTTL